MLDRKLNPTQNEMDFISAMEKVGETARMSFIYRLWEKWGDKTRDSLFSKFYSDVLRWINGEDSPLNEYLKTSIKGVLDGDNG